MGFLDLRKLKHLVYNGFQSSGPEVFQTLLPEFLHEISFVLISAVSQRGKVQVGPLSEDQAEVELV